MTESLLGVVLYGDGGDVKAVVPLLPSALHAVSAEPGQLSVHPQTKVVSRPLNLQTKIWKIKTWPGSIMVNSQETL